MHSAGALQPHHSRKQRVPCLTYAPDSEEVVGRREHACQYRRRAPRERRQRAAPQLLSVTTQGICEAAEGCLGGSVVPGCDANPYGRGLACSAACRPLPPHLDLDSADADREPPALASPVRRPVKLFAPPLRLSAARNVKPLASLRWTPSLLAAARAMGHVANERFAHSALPPK